MASTSSGYQRAAVVIGVDRVVPLHPLRAAAAGAETIAEWASKQDCDVRLHTDKGRSVVTRRDVLDSVRALVDRRMYDQLIIYFAGHGLLMAPGAEMWLLTEAAADHTEAVDALRTAEYARRAGIPHVVLISDACRAYVNGPPFYGVTGGSIFPPPTPSQRSADLDIYFGTAPGDPAYEIADESRPGYGIFTRCLLDVVTEPPLDIIEYTRPGPYPVLGAVAPATIPVVTSRALKDPLIKAVTDQIALVDPLLNQQPEVRAEAILPQFFAIVDDIGSRKPTSDDGTAPTPDEFGQRPEAADGRSPSTPAVHADDSATSAQRARSRKLSETFHVQGPFASHDQDGAAFVVVDGAGIRDVTIVGWEPGEQTQTERDVHRLELIPVSIHRPEPTSAVVEFGDGTGTVIAVIPGAVSAVAVMDGRVTGMNCRTIDQPLQGRDADTGDRYADLALVTEAALNGDLSAALNQGRRQTRRPRGRPRPDWMVSTTLRAYGAAERGLPTLDILRECLGDGLVSFDIAMLASQLPHEPAGVADELRWMLDAGTVHPFAPLLTRGWLLLQDSLLAGPHHAALSRHLVPALYTTFAADGMRIAHDAVTGRIVT